MRRLTTLTMRPFASRSTGSGMYQASNTVMVFHPPTASRRAIQEAVFQAVGEQSLRVVSPRDRDSGQRKGHSYLVMSSPDLAERFAAQGLQFEGESFAVRVTPDSAGVDQVGVTKQLFVQFDPELQLDRVVREVSRVAGQAPTKVSRPSIERSLVFLEFDTPETVIRVVANGVEIDGKEVHVDYGTKNDRAPQADGSSRGQGQPQQQQQRQQRNSAQAPEKVQRGELFTVSLGGLPIGTAAETVAEMIRAKSGLSPVRINMAEGGDSAIAYAEMATPAKAQLVAGNAFVVGADATPLQVRLRDNKYSAGIEVSIALDGRSRRLTVSLDVGESPDRVIEALTSTFGEAPTDVEHIVHQKGGSIRFSMSSPAVASRVFREGLELNGAARRIRIVDDQPAQPCSSLVLGNVPVPSTEEELAAAVEAGVGVAPVSVRMARHASTGSPRPFAFVEFGSPEAGAKALETIKAKGLTFKDMALTARFNTPRPTSDPARATATSSGQVQGRPVTIRHVLVPGVTVPRDDVYKAVERSVGAPAKYISIVDGNAHIIMTTPELLQALAAKGLELGGVTLRGTVETPIRNAELSGATEALHVSGVPANMEPKILVAAFAATGVTPVDIYQPPEQTYAFVKFASAEECTRAVRSPITIDGKILSMGFATPRPTRPEGEEAGAGGSDGRGSSFEGRTDRQ